jgi:dipeptidyl aminopeptidase/acylaminoacyl peptidase
MTEEHAADGGTPGHGWWPSPFDAPSVAAGKVSRSGLLADRGALVWTESRPDLGGRQVVVRSVDGGDPVVVSPDGVSVRSRVHEYGGGAATVSGDMLFYVDQADQRWHRVGLGRAGPDGDPVALTPAAGDDGVSVHHGDGRTTPSGRWLVTVEERLVGSLTTHRLVAVATDGSETVVPLVDDTDFVASPRPSPDGAWLAWTAWDHPSMPWDRSEVRVAPLRALGDHRIEVGTSHRVAGGGGCSVGQPHWARDGSLVFVDDRSGWWLPYRLPADRVPVEGAASEPMADRRAEFHAPDWALGQATLAELGDGSWAARMHEDGRDRLVRLRPGTGGGATAWSLEVVDQPCVSLSGVVALGGGPSGGRPDPGGESVAVLGSTTTEAHGVFEVAPEGRDPAVRRSTAPSVAVDPADVSTGRPFAARTPSGTVPGLFFAPANARVGGPAPGPPPLVVFCHGGPTSSADPGFDPVVQFFTSRGLAVAAVDYRGSTGYGSEYRRILAGRWGEADVDDCAAFAEALVGAGLVDGDRMAVRGTSAGGLTALGSLIRSDRFAGAASWYGVTDLEALATDTHDFESRYLDSLVGPWPDAAASYRARSPLHHPDRVTGSVLLLQGADDPVVPADQSERFAARLAEHGVPCRLTVFAGESHGFRRADTIEACLTLELDFYRDLFAS